MTSMSVQAPINFSNSEFYGFSEFFYCTEDVLRLGGQYDSHKYSRAAAVTTPATFISSSSSFALFVAPTLTGFVCSGFSAGVLRHQVVHAETASGQQTVLSARRRQQSQVSLSDCCPVSQHDTKVLQTRRSDQLQAAPARPVCSPPPL